MRQIKFRAWDTLKKKIISWEEMLKHKGILWSVLGLSTKTSYEHQFDKVGKTKPLYIPLQFTGLKDKNGKEIYEGDIVLDAWGIKQKVIIGEIEHVDREDTFAGYGFGFSTHCLEDFEEKVEVVGNIYENPVLLGGSTR